MNLDSIAFISRLRALDQKAFNHLVQKFHLQLVNFSASIVGRDLAEEVVQESWVSIYRALPGFEGRSSLKTWLFTIVKNESFAKLKAEKRHKGSDGASVEAGSMENASVDNCFNEDGTWATELADWHLNTPDALLQEKQLYDCLRKAILALNSDNKAVFELKDLEDFSFDEICNILDITYSNARVLLHRARMELFKVVDHYQETGEC